MPVGYERHLSGSWIIGAAKDDVLFVDLSGPAVCCFNGSVLRVKATIWGFGKHARSRRLLGDSGVDLPRFLQTWSRFVTG